MGRSQEMTRAPSGVGSALSLTSGKPLNSSEPQVPYLDVAVSPCVLGYKATGRNNKIK